MPVYTLPKKQHPDFSVPNKPPRGPVLLDGESVFKTNQLLVSKAGGARNLVNGGMHTVDLHKNAIGTKGPEFSYNGSTEFDETDYLVGDLDNWTIACYCRGDSAPGSSTNNGVCMSSLRVQIGWDHSNPDFRGAMITATSGGFFSASFGTLEADRWYVLAGSWDGSNLKSYVDGVLITTTPTTGTAGADSSHLFLGKHADASNFWAGSIIQTCVHNRALSDSELLNLSRDFFQLVKPINPPTYFTVEEAVGVTASTIGGGFSSNTKTPSKNTNASTAGGGLSSNTVAKSASTNVSTIGGGLSSNTKTSSKNTNASTAGGGLSSNTVAKSASTNVNTVGGGFSTVTIAGPTADVIPVPLPKEYHPDWQSPNLFKPRVEVEIDWDNPDTEGLFCVLLPGDSSNLVNLVDGVTKATPVTNALAPRQTVKIGNKSVTFDATTADSIDINMGAIGQREITVISSVVMDNTTQRHAVVQWGAGGAPDLSLFAETSASQLQISAFSGTIITGVLGDLVADKTTVMGWQMRDTGGGTAESQQWIGDQINAPYATTGANDYAAETVIRLGGFSGVLLGDYNLFFLYKRTLSDAAMARVMANPKSLLKPKETPIYFAVEAAAGVTASTVGGGLSSNTVVRSASSNAKTIGGGFSSNTVAHSANTTASTVGGGFSENIISRGAIATAETIGGGFSTNTKAPSKNTTASTIGGGFVTQTTKKIVAGISKVIGGGFSRNTVSRGVVRAARTIAGGFATNTVARSASTSAKTIGGGFSENTKTPNKNTNAKTIGGGFVTQTTKKIVARISKTIGGGFSGNIVSRGIVRTARVIGGGFTTVFKSPSKTTDADTTGGGFATNTTLSDKSTTGSTIGGGFSENTVARSTSTNASTTGGGFSDNIASRAVVRTARIIGGGFARVVAVTFERILIRNQTIKGCSTLDQTIKGVSTLNQTIKAEIEV